MYNANGNRTGFTFFSISRGKEIDEFGKIGCPERQGRTGVVIEGQNYPRYWVPLEFSVGSLWIPSQKVGSLYQYA